MKFTLSAVVAFFAILFQTHAKTPTIGIEIYNFGHYPTVVAIYSDSKDSNRQGLSVEQATKAIKNIQGSGQKILVGIVSHRVAASDYLPLLKAISENQILSLSFIENDGTDLMRQDIKKQIEQGAAANP